MTINTQVVVSFIVGLVVYHIFIYPARFKQDYNARQSRSENYIQ